MGRMTWYTRCVVVVLLALAVAGCSRTPPEQRLRETIGELGEAIERRDAAAVEEVLAEDFVGPQSLDRDGARRMAALLFLRFRDVGTAFGPVDVDLQPGHATARFNVGLTGGSGAVLPDSARLYDVETGWREVDGEWRLTSARWTPRL
ncbi:nuclear transport factor 2 family protein [Lysobacter sp.]|uniref:nuclear transport factor 2 family protein n=1 Tax=Lysobacter sp. TaxID=72226 RepID=UPI002D616DBF|nr:nuclear transport factor 2 family protein [Lysobacter sp.]HZX77675.1 nuclear transport factor 2 family protein [Lysobacter sp.]